jgi:hypothetical protein
MEAGLPVNSTTLFFIIVLNIVVWGLTIIATVKILHRMGFSGWWTLMFGLWPIGLWLLAFNRWPALDKDAASLSDDRL